MFEVNAILKGLITEVKVEEPTTLDCHEFKIDFFNIYVKDALKIKLEKGRWHLADYACSTNNKQAPFEVEPVCSLEELEIEAIGLEIAKYWKMKLEVNLQLYSDVS